MAYIPLTGQSSNPFAQIPDGITPGTKVKVVATGYRSGEPNVVLESDPVTILTRPVQEKGYFEKNYPFSKLMQEIQNSSPGDVIDLENKVYWLNINEAVGDDGITYPPVNELASPLNFCEINHSIEIKNGTIILFEECNLTEESAGIYSCSYNSEGRKIVQIFDPGENNVKNPPRFAKYPPQPNGVFTDYTTDENSFLFDKNDDSINKTGNLILLPNEDNSCERCVLSGIFINTGYTAGLSLANEIKDILDVVSEYSGLSGRTEAAIDLPMFYRAVPNIIKITTISDYEESAAGLTLMFSDTYEREDEDESHYVREFNFFGSGAFLNYGQGPSENVSVYATDISQNKLTYKPARGECLQLWRNVDSYYSGNNSKPGYNSGCFFIQGTQPYDESTDTFPDTVILDNITFVGNASYEGTSRGKIIYADSACNFIIKNCNAYYGDGFFTNSLSGGELLLENTLISFPVYGSVNITPFGEKTIKNCRFVGNQQKSAISTTNTQGDLFTGYINVYGNYFDLGTSNHGQGISSYASAWARYKIWGNIFHNCQRSISFQHGAWSNSNPDLFIDGELDMGTGYVLANNLIYHDQNPVTPLNGQLGVAWNSTSPQSQLILTVDDPSNQYEFSAEQVRGFRFQRFNGTNFEDINFAPEFGLPEEEGHVLNIDYILSDVSSPPWNSGSSVNFAAGAYDYDFDSENYFEKSLELKTSERNYFTGYRRFFVSVEGKDELSDTGYDTNVFLGLIQQYEEPLYVRTIPQSGNESEYSFEGIPVLNVQFFKDVPIVEIFRNSFLVGYSYASYIEENGDEYNIFRGGWVNLRGSGRDKDTNGDGENDIIVDAAGSNGPLYMQGNILYDVDPGFSGGDINNPNYDITSRRLFGGVTFQDNIILRPTPWVDEVWYSTNDILRETIPDYTYLKGLTHIYDNLQNGDPTPKPEFKDRGILFTHNGLPTGIPIYPDLRELRNLDLNWADAYKPVHPDLLRGEQTTETITYSITHPNYNTKFQTDEYSWTLTSETPIVQGTFLDGTPWVLDTGSLKLINVSPRQKTIETNEGTGLINRTVINLDGSKFYGDLQYSGISYGDKRVSVRASDNTDFSPLFMLHPFDYRAGFNGNPIDDAAILNKIITVSTNNNFIVDGIETPTLDVIRTKTYNFDQSDESNLNRQLKISTDSNGANLFSGYSYTGTAGQDGVASVTIPSDLSITDLYYFTDGVGTTGGKLSINRIGKGYDSSQGIDFSDLNGYTLESGDMVITSTSYEGNLTKSRDPYIESYGCLTVVSEIPPSNAFRPPVNWDPNDKANRPIFTENDTFSDDLLTYPNYSLSSDEFIDFSSDSDISLDQVSRYGTITPYYIGKDGSSYDGTIKSLDQINREYGGYQAISEEKLMLCVFDPQTDVNVRNTARRVVAQRGIDTFGAYYSLGKHAAHNGYINGEYNPRVFFAWAVCGDSRMFDVLNFTVGNTYNGTYKEYDYTGDKLGLGLLPTYHETRQGTLNCNLCSHRHFDIPIVETGNVENQNYVIVSRPSRINDLTAEQSPPLHLSSIYTGAYETWGWANNTTIPGKEIISSYIRLKSEGNPDKITRIVNAEAIIGNGVDKDPEFFKLFLQDNIIDGTETVCDISNALEETRSNLLTRIISGGLSNTSTEAGVYAYTYSVISHILSNFLISKSKGGRDFVPKWAQYQIDKAIWFTSTYPGKTALIQNGNSTYNLGMKSSTDRFTTDSLYYALCRQEIAQGVKLNEVPGENDLVFTDPTVWYDLPETKTWEELTYPAGNIIYYTRSLASTNNPAPLYNYSDNSYYRRTKYFFSYQREEDAKIVFEMWSRFTDEDSIPWGNIKDLKLYSWVSGALSPVGLTLESTTATDDADIDWKAYWVYDDPEIYYTSTEVSILFVDQS